MAPVAPLLTTVTTIIISMSLNRYAAGDLQYEESVNYFPNNKSGSDLNRPTASIGSLTNNTKINQAKTHLYNSHEEQAKAQNLSSLNNASNSRKYSAPPHILTNVSFDNYYSLSETIPPEENNQNNTTDIPPFPEAVINERGNPRSQPRETAGDDLKSDFTTGRDIILYDDPMMEHLKQNNLPPEAIADNGVDRILNVNARAENSYKTKNSLKTLSHILLSESKQNSNNVVPIDNVQSASDGIDAEGVNAFELASTSRSADSARISFTDKSKPSSLYGIYEDSEYSNSTTQINSGTDSQLISDLASASGIIGTTSSFYSDASSSVSQTAFNSDPENRYKNSHNAVNRLNHIGLNNTANQDKSIFSGASSGGMMNDSAGSQSTTAEIELHEKMNGSSSSEGEKVKVVGSNNTNAFNAIKKMNDSNFSANSREARVMNNREDGAGISNSSLSLGTMGGVKKFDTTQLNNTSNIQMMPRENTRNLGANGNSSNSSGIQRKNEIIGLSNSSHKHIISVHTNHSGANNIHISNNNGTIEDKNLLLQDTKYLSTNNSNEKNEKLIHGKFLIKNRPTESNTKLLLQSGTENKSTEILQNDRFTTQNNATDKLLLQGTKNVTENNMKILFHGTNYPTENSDIKNYTQILLQDAKYNTEKQTADNHKKPLLQDAESVVNVKHNKKLLLQDAKYYTDQNSSENHKKSLLQDTESITNVNNDKKLFIEDIDNSEESNISKINAKHKNIIYTQSSVFTVTSSDDADVNITANNSSVNIKTTPLSIKPNLNKEPINNYTQVNLALNNEYKEINILTKINYPDVEIMPIVTEKDKLSAKDLKAKNEPIVAPQEEIKNEAFEYVRQKHNISALTDLVDTLNSSSIKSENTTNGNATSADNELLSQTTNNYADLKYINWPIKDIRSDKETIVDLDNQYSRPTITYPLTTKESANDNEDINSEENKRHNINSVRMINEDQMPPTNKFQAQRATNAPNVHTKRNQENGKIEDPKIFSAVTEKNYNDNESVIIPNINSEEPKNLNVKVNDNNNKIEDPIKNSAIEEKNYNGNEKTIFQNNNFEEPKKLNVKVIDNNHKIADPNIIAAIEENNYKGIERVNIHNINFEEPKQINVKVSDNNNKIEDIIKNSAIEDKNCNDNERTIIQNNNFEEPRKLNVKVIDNNNKIADPKIFVAVIENNYNANEKTIIQNNNFEEPNVLNVKVIDNNNKIANPKTFSAIKENNYGDNEKTVIQNNNIDEPNKLNVKVINNNDKIEKPNTFPAIGEENYTGSERAKKQNIRFEEPKTVNIALVSNSTKENNMLQNNKFNAGSENDARTFNEPKKSNLPISNAEKSMQQNIELKHSNIETLPKHSNEAVIDQGNNLKVPYNTIFSTNHSISNKDKLTDSSIKIEDAKIHNKQIDDFLSDKIIDIGFNFKGPNNMSAILIDNFTNKDRITPKYSKNNIRAREKKIDADVEIENQQGATEESVTGNNYNILFQESANLVISDAKLGNDEGEIIDQDTKVRQQEKNSKGDLMTDDHKIININQVIVGNETEMRINESYARYEKTTSKFSRNGNKIIGANSTKNVSSTSSDEGEMIDQDIKDGQQEENSKRDLTTDSHKIINFYQVIVTNKTEKRINESYTRYENATSRFTGNKIIAANSTKIVSNTSSDKGDIIDQDIKDGHQEENSKGDLTTDDHKIINFNQVIVTNETEKRINESYTRYENATSKFTGNKIIAVTSPKIVSNTSSDEGEIIDQDMKDGQQETQQERDLTVGNHKIINFNKLIVTNATQGYMNESYARFRKASSKFSQNGSKIIAESGSKITSDTSNENEWVQNVFNLRVIKAGNEQDADQRSSSNLAISMAGSNATKFAVLEKKQIKFLNSQSLPNITYSKHGKSTPNQNNENWLLGLSKDGDILKINDNNKVATVQKPLSTVNKNFVELFGKTHGNEFNVSKGNQNNGISKSVYNVSSGNQNISFSKMELNVSGENRDQVSDKNEIPVQRLLSTVNNNSNTFVQRIGKAHGNEFNVSNGNQKNSDMELNVSGGNHEHVTGENKRRAQEPLPTVHNNNNTFDELFGKAHGNSFNVSNENQKNRINKSDYNTSGEDKNIAYSKKELIVSGGNREHVSGKSEFGASNETNDEINGNILHTSGVISKHGEIASDDYTERSIFKKNILNSLEITTANISYEMLGDDPNAYKKSTNPSIYQKSSNASSHKNTFDSIIYRNDSSTDIYTNSSHININRNYEKNSNTHVSNTLYGIWQNSSHISNFLKAIHNFSEISNVTNMGPKQIHAKGNTTLQNTPQLATTKEQTVNSPDLFSGIVEHIEPEVIARTIESDVTARTPTKPRDHLNRHNAMNAKSGQKVTSSDDPLIKTPRANLHASKLGENKTYDPGKTLLGRESGNAPIKTDHSGQDVKMSPESSRAANDLLSTKKAKSSVHVEATPLNRKRQGIFPVGDGLKSAVIKRSRAITDRSQLGQGKNPSASGISITQPSTEPETTHANDAQTGSYRREGKQHNETEYKSEKTVTPSVQVDVPIPYKTTPMPGRATETGFNQTSSSPHSTGGSIEKTRDEFVETKINTKFPGTSAPSNWCSNCTESTTVPDTGATAGFVATSSPPNITMPSPHDAALFTVSTLNISTHQDGLATDTPGHTDDTLLMGGGADGSGVSPNSTVKEFPWPVKREAVVEGDIVLGGLMMVHEREDSVTCGPVMPQGGIQALEAMLYTLDRLNEGSSQLLPNVTLGAHILDDCDKDTYGLEMAVDFIKGEFQVLVSKFCRLRIPWAARISQTQQNSVLIV